MNNATNIVDLIVGINNVSGEPYLLGYMLLLSFAVIFLIMSFRYDFTQVIIIDSFLSTIIAIMLFVAGLLPITIIIYPLIFLIISLVFYMFF